MSVDIQGLRSSIRAIEEQAARLRRIADDAEHQAESSNGGTTVGLDLPPEIVVRDAESIGRYIRAHPDLADVVREMAAALVQEFSGERSEIELAVYQDPEIDDCYLTYYVRVPMYDESLMPRLDAVADRFDDRRIQTDGWILVTSDFEPLA